MVAQTESRLKKIMDALRKTGKEYNIKINVKMIKACRDGNKREGGDLINVKINEQEVEQATHGLLTRFQKLMYYID